jgi:murein L,D-transpeptidase YafK
MTTRRHWLAAFGAAAIAGPLSLAPAAAGPLRADEVVVLKGARRMLLLYRGRVVRRYRIALGFAPTGHKQREGDGRTPEGRYVIDWRNPKSRFTLSLHVSYPNRADRAAARRRGVDPGGDIFIHGLPNGSRIVGAAHSLRDWTLGCIAVTSEEIREIWNAVPNGTPIEIRP